MASSRTGGPLLTRKLPLLLCILVATDALATESPKPISERRMILAVPLEVDIVGLAAGIHPEVLWRPSQKDSSFHLRAATALKPGSEFTLFAPLSVGARWLWFRESPVQVGLGTGLQWKAFLVPNSGAHQRIDWYWEATVEGRVDARQRIGIAAVPEFGMANITGDGFSGTFGLGLAFRATWSYRYR